MVEEINGITMDRYTSVQKYTDAIEERFTEYLDLEAAEYRDLGNGHKTMTPDIVILKYYNEFS